MLALAFNSLRRFHFRPVFERFIDIHPLFPHAVLDDFADQDMKNIERIEKVLKTTKSREQQKALVKKYLGWVSRQRKRNTNCYFLFSMLFLSTSEKSERW